MTARGDHYMRGDVLVEVMRITRAGDYADLKIRPTTGPHWSERERLPLPDTYRKVSTP